MNMIIGKFPRYLLIILAAYLAVFLISLVYYVGPAISIGLGYMVEFYISLLILVLPLILSVVYLFTSLGHDTIFRIVIFVSTIISFIYFFVFIFTLLI